MTYILTEVYRVDFGEEIAFTMRMVLLLSNMEGNLDLCTEKKHHHVGEESTSAI